MNKCFYTQTQQSTITSENSGTKLLKRATKHTGRATAEKLHRQQRL